jgi:hypothetical protein
MPFSGDQNAIPWGVGLIPKEKLQKNLPNQLQIASLGYEHMSS